MKSAIPWDFVSLLISMMTLHSFYTLVHIAHFFDVRIFMLLLLFFINILWGCDTSHFVIYIKKFQSSKPILIIAFRSSPFTTSQYLHLPTTRLYNKNRTNVKLLLKRRWTFLLLFLLISWPVLNRETEEMKKARCLKDKKLNLCARFIVYLCECGSASFFCSFAWANLIKMY